MGRKSKYETNVEPFLKDIPNWLNELAEYQIAKKLNVSVSAFERYKKQYPELVEAIRKGNELLVDDLKTTLKKKAHGFYYTETKTVIRKDGGKDVKMIEKYEKYAQPDTGAIHLLLKNLDDSWHNDDVATLKMKQEQIDIAKEKLENEKW